MRPEIVDLPIVFPNLIFLNVLADGMPKRYLMPVIDRLDHLRKFLCISSRQPDQGLQRICDPKKIEVKFMKTNPDPLF